MSENPLKKSEMWEFIYKKLFDLKSQGMNLVEVDLGDDYAVLLSVDEKTKTVLYASWDKDFEDKPENLDDYLELPPDWNLLDDVYNKLK